MKKLKGPKVILALLAAVLSAPAAFAQSTQPQASSAQNSPKSDTRVGEQKAVSRGQSRNQQLVNACSAAIDDLRANRDLVEALTGENTVLKNRLETERQTTTLLTELNATRKSETDALRETVAAKNEAIAAKDAVIASQDKLIETLKNKKSSPWKRLGDVLIGAAIFAILK